MILIETVAFSYLINRTNIVFVQELVTLLDKTLVEHFKRQEERAGKRAGGEEDYDEGVEEQLEDEDDEDVYILSKVIKKILGVMYNILHLRKFSGLNPVMRIRIKLMLIRIRIFDRLCEKTDPTQCVNKSVISVFKNTIFW